MATAGTGPREGALAELVEAIRQLEGLTAQVGTFTLPADTGARSPDLVAAVCRVLGVPLRFDGRPGQDHTVGALALRIRLAQANPVFADLGEHETEALAARAGRLRDEEAAWCRPRSVRRPDGTVLRVLDAGPPQAPCVVISPACAMDVRLCLPWLDALRGRYRCLAVQTRGTNEPIEDPGEFDRRGHGVAHQTADLLAVIDEFALSGVHLMALCGGAVPALAAVAGRPEVFASLSIWHGDLEFGGDVPKTAHQANLRALLDIAGESRESAAWVRERLVSGPMEGVPDGVGPLVVRPYATAELFYRYANLTGATMHWDCRETASRVGVPTLVVTSEDDDTAHPDGSRRLVEILADATVEVTEHGTHLDAFRATAAQVRRLTSFLAERGPRPGLPALSDTRSTVAGS